MGDEITIGVTEIVNNIEVTAQPNDQVIDINVTDNSDEVTLNVTPNVIEVNVNKGSSYARWGSIFGNLTDQADLTNSLFNKADLVDGKVPSYQLPSFVDDVIEVANYAALPTVGEIGKIYITLDDNKIYRWSGSIYIEIASNQAIWGAITGSLTNQTDLVNALNLKADKSTTLTINGTTFDLSANRTYTIPTHDAVTLGTANGLSLSGQVLSLGLAGASSNGALSSTDWNTFNNKLSSLSGAVLTTTDQSIAGVKTFTNLSKFTNNTGFFAVEIDTTSSDALVVKNNGTTTLQIGRNGEILGVKYKVSGGFSSQFLKANGDLDSTVYTPASRTITINGVTQDLTANRSFTVATHDAVTIGTANGLSLSGQALSLALASGSTTGALSSTDWTTFNNKLSSLSGAVLTTTDQTITGTKTFTNTIGINTTGVSISLNSISTGLEIIADGSTSSNRNISFKVGSTLAAIINSSGYVGIGTPSPNAKLEIVGGVNTYQRISNSTNSVNLDFLVGNATDGGFIGTGSNHPLRLATNDTERMRITSGGDVLVGTTTAITSSGNTSVGATFGKSYNWLAITDSNYVQRSNNTDGAVLTFLRGATNVGNISITSSATSYNTSSDYRLKQDLKPINGLDLVSQIKVYDYEWKSDKTRAYGVLAHELQEVIPQAVNGEKDGENMQGVDYSKLVPILVQAIQELKAEIELLKQK